MAKITWTIKGKLKVRTQFDELKAKKFADDNGDVPLAGVRVRVSAKETKLDPTGFAKWGEVVTKEDGSFQFTISKDKSKRYFKVEVLFDSKDTIIYPGSFIALPGNSAVEAGMNATMFDVDWILVWQDEEKKGPGVVDFRNLTFAGIAGEQLDGRDERCHADLWALAGIMRSELEKVGNGLGFQSQRIAIKYPHSDPLVNDGDEIAYADPIRRIVFLVRNGSRDDFEIQTVMHEVMHVRNYAHSTGEENLAIQLLLNGSTHEGRQDMTFTVFHEAAAEIFKSELYHQMFGKRALIYRDKDFEAERKPFTRPWLKSQGIKTLKDLDHYEYGWMSVFNLLLCNKVEELDMNGAGPYAREKAATTSGPKAAIARKSVNFTFADLLRAFDPIFNPVPDEFPNQIDVTEMTLNKYFKRLGAALASPFDDAMQSAYKKILDPAETA
ncbi:MAG TPA: hypothetical protein VF251_10720, partial [Pyrinomonadaceae bacterium]